MSGADFLLVATIIYAAGVASGVVIWDVLCARSKPE
jgi:hypothetical protein